MALPVFFPLVRYTPVIEGESISLFRLCEAAGVGCSAFGAWTQRPVIVSEAQTPSILSEPDDWGVVKISTPLGLSPRNQARWALGAMAYAIFDGVARASIAGKPWSRAALPPGRPPGEKKPMSNALRQQRHRISLL